MPQLSLPEGPHRRDIVPFGTASGPGLLEATFTDASRDSGLHGLIQAKRSDREEPDEPDRPSRFATADRIPSRTVVGSRVSLKHLRIDVGDTSLGRDVGAYYLDFGGVVELVESGYHGRLDGRGVPLVRLPSGREVYNASTISQYTLALHTRYSEAPSGATRTRFDAQVERLVAMVSLEAPVGRCLLNDWDDPKYPSLRAPWVSAITLGNALSALVRAYCLDGDETLIERSSALYRALECPIECGGVRATDSCGHLWLEEYPTSPPNHVLNGFVFALWGVLDYARVTGAAGPWALWRSGVDTLRAHLADYDTGYWSLYDLQHRELASPHYHGRIHRPQLEALHRLTGDPIFEAYAQRWHRSFRQPWSRLRYWLSVRAQARMGRPA